MTISDITAHIKHKDRNYVKRLLEEMHKDGDIDFAGSGRYFIYSEKKKSSQKSVVKKSKPRKTLAPKTDSVADEIKKFADLKDQGILTQEEFDAKKKELLGL